MKTAGTVLGVVMLLFGFLWMGQGLSLIGGGFMVGDIKWTYIGAGVALAGAALLARARRRA